MVNGSSTATSTDDRDVASLGEEASREASCDGPKASREAQKASRGRHARVTKRGARTGLASSESGRDGLAIRQTGQQPPVLLNGFLARLLIVCVTRRFELFGELAQRRSQPRLLGNQRAAIAT